MSDGFKIQVNVKVGDTLINLRGDTPDEVERILGWAEQNATTIASTIGALHAQGNVAAAFPGSQNVPQTQPDQGSWSQQGSQQAPPAFAQPATPPAGGQGPAPQCTHGQMKWVDPPNKPWKAWMCPTPQGTPNQCKPQFVNG